MKYTTEIEYEGIEPSSTPHVLDARFSQANVFYGGPGGHCPRVLNPFLSTSYSLNLYFTTQLFECQAVKVDPNLPMRSALLLEHSV